MIAIEIHLSMIDKIHIKLSEIRISDSQFLSPQRLRNKVKYWEMHKSHSFFESKTQI